MHAAPHILLKEVAEVFTGPPAPSARVRTVLRDAGPIEAPLLTVGAIGEKAVISDEIKTVYADTESVLADYRVTEGDILLAARSTLKALNCSTSLIRCSLRSRMIRSSIALMDS